MGQFADDTTLFNSNLRFKTKLVPTITSKLNIQKAFIQNTNSAVIKFISRKKKDKIKCRTTISDYGKGGLPTPSKDTMAQFLSLAQIPRLLLKEETLRTPGRQFPTAYWTNIMR